MTLEPMNRDFNPVLADGLLENDLKRLITLGSDEDLHALGDVTTLATVPPSASGDCVVTARQAGTAAGLVTVPWMIEALGYDLEFRSELHDGQAFEAGRSLGVLRGPAQQILTAERLILNMLSRLCGVASLTAAYVQRLGNSPARLYDTRKTTVGWRRLEKYAVRCGGGHNHRTGLYDAILIKDNHLALARQAQADETGDSQPQGSVANPAGAIRQARHYIQQLGAAAATMIIEVEVDTLSQLEQALSESPDIVLVDNFSLPELRQAVALRDQLAPQVSLEASGGISLETIGAIAQTGVNRISCGAITHQATWLDLGLDWLDSRAS
ncbi:nicotinate-nucleotide diphosphorylase [Planctomycetaceae bacterium SH139]